MERTVSVPGETTGRFLVLVHEEGGDEAVAAAAEAAGSDAVVFEELGVAVVSPPAGRHAVLAATAEEHEGILALEPERRVHAISEAPVAAPEPQTTWGLEAVRVPASRFAGRGVRVAILDTGLDVAHPDFAGRTIERRSFIARQGPDDGHGHGTHVTGTACGPLKPQHGPRYGIAYEAEIWSGKVLGNDGSGADGGILDGINWAVANSCRVASMSLGAPVEPGQAYSRVFEAAARRALAKGTLIVAAAGNDSDRAAGLVRPVGHPANCPSILAVAALTKTLGVADFSNRGTASGGGRIDIAAPGVGVVSAWPHAPRYRALDGTSMATPHVAGVVALLVESEPKDTAAATQELLLKSAKSLRAAALDVGAGLVQAP
jgi:subtilisin